MKTQQQGDVWVVSLERGDSMRASIEDWAKSNGIVCAQISGIGALEDAELGCYELTTKSYERRIFQGIWEVLTCDGNITLKDGAPFLHAHVAISGHDYITYGGHLFDAKVGVAVEMFIRPLEKPLHRFMCDDIGLPRWEPGKA